MALIDKKSKPKKAADSKSKSASPAKKAAVPKPAGEPAALDQAVAAATAAGAMASDAGSDAVNSSFDEFFSGVATSFANAQHTLDQRTAEYLAEIKDRPELLPTAFRIAKVSADMKFAVDTVSTTSVGIIIFKDTNSTTVQNQQSVHFEMVAAPTPAGVTISTPAVPLMLSAGARVKVFAIIKPLSGAGDQTGAANLLVKPDRVLIFVEDPEESLYLAYAEDSNFGVWRLALAPVQLTAIRPFGAAAGVLGAVRASLAQLGVNQESFLNSIS
jgi:hypothetical protein